VIFLGPALALQAPAILSVPDPASPDTCVAVVVKLPQLGDEDWQTLELIAHVLPDGSMTYTRQSVLQLTDGHRVHVVLQRDALILSVEAPSRSSQGALKVISSILTEPALVQGELDDGIHDLLNQKTRYFDEEISRPKFSLSAVSSESAVTLFKRIIRPDRVSIAFGGSGSFADMQSKWADLTAGWQAQDDDSFQDLTPPKLALSEDEVQTLVLHGPEVLPSTGQLPAVLLATYALGVGKGSSLFRIPREKHGWSYLQSSFLSPTLAGWEPRLFVAALRKTFTENMISDLRQDLADDVKSWSEDDRTRALQMLEATLTRGVPYGAIWLGDGPVGESLQDRTEFSDYWMMKTGQPWDPQKLIDICESVDLDTLKTTALKIVG
jgi:hypothetical protein